MVIETGTQEILTESRDGTPLVRIHRPDRKNALTLAMYSGLTAALAEATRNCHPRARTDRQRRQLYQWQRYCRLLDNPPSGAFRKSGLPVSGGFAPV